MNYTYRIMDVRYEADHQNQSLNEQFLSKNYEFEIEREEILPEPKFPIG